MSAGHIYILSEREFINSGQNVYKIGMTENIVKRMRKLRKGKQLLLAIYTNNVRCVENYIFDKFAADFRARPDYGHGYFQGDVKAMMKALCHYVITNKV